MRTNQQIATLQTQRGAVIATMTALSEKIGTEARAFTDAERAEFDAAEKQAQAFTSDISRLEALERTQSLTVRPVPAAPAQPEDDPPVRIEVVPPAKLDKGMMFGRYALCIAVAKGNVPHAIEIAKARYPDTEGVHLLLKAQMLGGVTRATTVSAATTTNPPWMGALVPQAQTVVDEFIELVKPATIIGQLVGARTVPFNVRVPRVTSGITSAGWVGEGMSKPAGAGALDSVALAMYKAAIIVLLTQELLRLAPQSETIARDMMKDAIVTFLDHQFIDPAVAAAPTHPASITNGITPIPSSGGSLANISADIGKALAQLAAGSNMVAPTWIMSQRTAVNLSLVRTSQDVYAYRDELARGTFLGYPVIASSAVPTNLGTGTNESFIVLVDAHDILIAQDGGITIDTSSEASVQMDSAPATPPAPLVSLWQQNMVGLKAEEYIAWARGRDGSVQLISGVTY